MRSRNNGVMCMAHGRFRTDKAYTVGTWRMLFPEIGEQRNLDRIQALVTCKFWIEFSGMCILMCVGLWAVTLCYIHTIKVQ
jgi:hypothetical protein